MYTEGVVHPPPVPTLISRVKPGLSCKKIEIVSNDSVTYTMIEFWYTLL